MDNVFIRLVPLPLHVRAFTAVDSDGCFNVYVNSALSAEIRQDALAHEIEHISGGDFDGHTDIGFQELLLHNKK